MNDYKELVHGDLKLNVETRKVTFGSNVISLRNLEFTFMEFFMLNVGRVLTRTVILEEVWDRNICCSTNTIDVHVSLLRKKLSNASCHGLIRTVYCVGYVFGS